ncbi:hypothetical protein SAMN05216413_0063 [Ruminococcaceae bacterium KH2T8]|nr:hypothetical protein SAMN05216413_0063 [Ruminococcaceae bacterium KH2T8]
MGSWGTRIFDNDVSQEIKENYINNLKKGASAEETLSIVYSSCSECFSEPEDSIDSWLSLASVMFDYGRLTEEVRQKALEMIAHDMESTRWHGSEFERRKSALVELKEKLSSVQPDRKEVKIIKPHVPKIKPNEILELKLEDRIL